MAELTPMMKQYFAMKKQQPDAIVFYRCGDFYEMFHEDARIVSKELELTLTTRDKNKPPEEQTPMCGMPYHASEVYIAKLVEKGYKIAICEQIEDPATAKGIVKRDVVRVVTAGTVMESSMLDEAKNNFLAVVYCPEVNEMVGVETKMVLALCDISTGSLFVKEIPFGDKMPSVVTNELGRFAPSEVILSLGATQQKWLSSFLRESLRASCEEGQGFLEHFGRKAFVKQFPSQEVPTSSELLCCLGGLFQYLGDTQKSDMEHICKIVFLDEKKFMVLDLQARRNLELTETLWGREKKGSLLWVLDKTKTSMGGRLLQDWVQCPLLDVSEINKRHEAVGELMDLPMEHSGAREYLKGIPDMERMIARVSHGTGGCRELLALGRGLDDIGEMKKSLSSLKSEKIREKVEELQEIPELSKLLSSALKEELPVTVREGDMIAEGFHEEVDRLRHILNHGGEMITEMEENTKESTGIRNLRVRYNKVFGYFIEVAKAQAGSVPDHWVRKQTTVNSERFISEELKELEQTILSAKDQLHALEFQIFQALREETCKYVTVIQETARAVAEIDVLCSLAQVANSNNYVKPVMTEAFALEIEDGRHPVVENLVKDTLFVPNNTCFQENSHVCALITGPNMAGKSTYMRQVALIVIMAQMGSFIPASSGKIGVVDKIFTRIGASDDLGGGKSTFMVEMSEVAQLLSDASEKSLLILDEVGRGTSTYDGMAMAKAILEFCREKIGAKTLFATHYHELSSVEEELSGVVNYNIAAKQKGDEILFLRKILEGPADQSYGIQVAKLAGVPDEVIFRAHDILTELESGEGHKTIIKSTPTTLLMTPEEEKIEEIVADLRSLDLDDLSPRKALELVSLWKEKCR